MKYSVIFLVLVALPAYSQELQPFTFKGCNTVVVQAKDSAQVLFNRFLTHLEDQGYSIESNDKDRLTFATNAKKFKKNLSAIMSIKGQVRGNRIYLSGFVKSGSMTGSSNEMPVIDKGMSGSPMQEAFVALDHIAGLLTDSERFYLLR